MGDALGLIETKGLVACIEAADAMCKSANVELISYENIGSGLVTVMVKGDVGAVKAAVDSGVESAQRIGEVVTSLVIARPHNDINKLSLNTGLKARRTQMGDALGLIETKGLVACIEAADAMCKAANVELIGYENVGSGLVTAMVKGDVGAVKAAVDSGVESAQRIGEVVTSLVIARPHNDISKIISHYKIIE